MRKAQPSYGWDAQSLANGDLDRWKFLSPLRRILPTMGMLDLSPFVAMIVLQTAGNIATSVLQSAANNFR
ncbi:MAG: YggT family protein [Proteobacteria bacterium]|nr:YggT family protein [Pseudomonadota bacterium]